MVLKLLAPAEGAFSDVGGIRRCDQHHSAQHHASNGKPFPHRHLTHRILLRFQFGEQEKGPKGQLVPTNSPIRWRGLEVNTEQLPSQWAKQQHSV
jgi:hypothetical protein